MAVPAKPKRLEARITAEQKARFERAAQLQGRTLTDFVLGALEDAANKVIRDHEVLTLSARDSLAFAQAILDPPEPTPALLEAMREQCRSVEER